MRAGCALAVGGIRRGVAAGVLAGLAFWGTGCGKRVAATPGAAAAPAVAAAPAARAKMTVVYVLSQGTMEKHQDPDGKVRFVLTPALISAFVPNPATGQVGYLANFPEPSGVEADWIVQDPRNRVIYVADMATAVIHGYVVNRGNGQLQEIRGSPFDTIFEPRAMAFTPDGRYMYVASQGRNAVAAYAVDTATSDLTPVRGSPFATTGTKMDGCSVAVTPDGRTLLSADMENVYSFRIDEKTGGLTLVSTVAGPLGAGGIVIDRSGAAAYVVRGWNGIRTYSIDRATGKLALAAVSRTTVGEGASTLVLTPDERFAYTVEGGDKVVAYRLKNGRFTDLRGRWWPGASGTYQLAIDPAGRFLFAPQVGKAKSLSVWAIDRKTGLLHPAPGSPTPIYGNQPEGVLVVTQ